MERIIPDIVGDVVKKLEGDAKVLPHQSNWASVLSDKCLRKLVYYRTDYDMQTKPGAWLQGIFNTGRKLEDIVINICNGIGTEAKLKWKLIDTGVKLNDAFLKSFQIGGEPDTFLKVWPEKDGRPFVAGPVEIKGFDSNLFKQINTIQDFNKYKWMLKYLGQLQLYEIGSNFETGWFLIFNKSNLWEYKFIEYPLDLEFVDKLTAKATVINESIVKKVLPKKINDPDECPRCPFVAMCKPDYSTGGNMEISEDTELEAVLTRLLELDDVKGEIKGLEKHRDASLIKGQDLICGKFVVTWKKSIISYKAKPASQSEQWRKKIICAL